MTGDETTGSETTAVGDLSQAALFAGPGELRALCRAHDWAATSLGQVESWSSPLRTTAANALASGFASLVLWGPAFVQLYNDAYVPFLGVKHPACLGTSAPDCWPEVWGVTQPLLARVFSGETVTLVDQLFPLERRSPGAPPDEVHVTISYAPVRDDAGAAGGVGGVGGVLVTLVDTSAQVAARALMIERERLLAELGAERERLRSVILHMPSPLALHVGPEHRFELVNDAFRRISGGGRDDTGLTVREAFPELTGQGIIEALDRVWATGEAWVGSEIPIHYDRDGTGPQDTWYDVRYEPARDAGGRVVGILNFAADVTTQVRARHAVERLLAESERARADADAALSALAASEARFRTVQDASPLGFCIHRPIRDADGAVVDLRTTYINAAGAQIVGQPPERVMAERLLTIWPSAGAEGIVADYARVLATGASNVRELLYEHDELAAGLTLTAVRIGEGADAEVGVTFTDITARLRAERERARLLAELGAERERLRSLVLQMPTPVGLHEGPELRFTMVNDAYKRASGGERDVIGLTPQEAFPDLAEQGFYERLARVYATGEAWLGPETLARLDRDGTGARDTWFTLRYEPLRDGAGRVTGVLQLGVDVTDQVRARREVERLLAASEEARAEAEAERARADAERERATAADRAKAEFLATMSHELRTPLNAIAGYAELLALGVRGPVTEAQQADLARIQASQRHLLGLVNEVLDLAKVDAGAVTVARATVAAAGTVDAALALVRPQAAAKAIALTAWCDAPPEGLEAVRYLGDEARVRQILVNLLANAVKFTLPGGSVAVTCALGESPPSASPDDAGGTPSGISPSRPAAAPYLALRVADTGVGIAADQRERIFEPFTQAGAGTNPYTRVVGGTGLGLTISRRLARLMGGDLTVESATGVGSTFTLWLPLAERRTHARPASALPSTPAAGGGDAEVAGAGVRPDMVLARLGDSLLAEAGPVVRAWAARLRADVGIPTSAPDGRAFTDVELEDHAATFVTDVALALRTLAAGGDDTSALLHDGAAILGTLAERHGAQRARLGWPAAAVARELALLGEELDAVLGRVARASEAVSVARAREAAARLIAHATRASLGEHRAAVPDAPVAP